MPKIKIIQNPRKNMDVEVRPSTIKGAGDGLFATADFREGLVICDYGDPLTQLVETKLAESVNYNSDYVFKINKDWSIDDQEKKTYGSHANDPIIKSKSNATIRKVPGKTSAHVVAIKRIKANQEIFINYGPDYWMDHSRFEKLPYKEQMYLYRHGNKEFRKFVKENYEL